MLIHGSGALDRNETIYQNKPFRDIAVGLAANNISSLRYDKRTFVYPTRVTNIDDETIDDAIQAIEIAHKYSDNVFLLGHSLGAMLAPIIAQRIGDRIKGIIMMAAPTQDLAEIVSEQLDYLLPSGASQTFKDNQLNQIKQSSPHYFLPYHQVDIANGLSLPMLILQGERDYQVRMYNFDKWFNTLSYKPNVEFRSYPLLNHLFMEGEGVSSPIEYQTKSTVASYVIDDIATFIANAMQ